MTTAEEREPAWLIRMEKAIGTHSMSDFAAIQIARQVRGWLSDLEAAEQRAEAAEDELVDLRQDLQWYAQKLMQGGKDRDALQQRAEAAEAERDRLREALGERGMG